MATVTGEALTRRRRRELNADRLWAVVLPLGVFLVVGAVWQFLASRSDSLIIPTFLETLTGLYELMMVDGDVWEALLLSNQAFVIGYVLAVAIGLPLGLALARMPALDTVADPYLSIWIAMPTAPLIPIIIMAIGIGLWSRVVLVLVFALIYITINTRAGVRSVDRSLVEMAKSFGASEQEVWRRVLLPGSAPALLAGLRLGMARAIDGMIVAELLLVAVGIGNLLLRYRAQFEGGLMFGTVLIVALEASILISLMRILERRFTRWI